MMLIFQIRKCPIIWIKCFVHVKENLTAIPLAKGNHLTTVRFIPKMMWCICLAFLIAARGSLGDSEEKGSCLKRRVQEYGCDSRLYPSDFPNSTEELRTICSNVKRYGRCMLKVAEGCPDMAEMVQPSHDTLDCIDDLCGKDSAKFEEISSNIECIANVGRKYRALCDFASLSDEAKRQIVSYMRNFLANETNLSDYDDLCLSLYMKLVCFSVTIGHFCGGNTEAVVYDVIKNAEMNLKMCGAKKLNEMESLYAPFKSSLIRSQRG